jgi:hypothetical protein
MFAVVGRVIPAGFGGGAGCKISPALVAPVNTRMRIRLLAVFIGVLLEINISVHSMLGHT